MKFPRYTRHRFKIGHYWRNLETDTDERRGQPARPVVTEPTEPVAFLEINADGAARLSWPHGGVTIPADVAAKVFPDLDALRENGVDVSHYGSPDETSTEDREAQTYRSFCHNRDEDWRGDMPHPKEQQ